MRNLIPLTVAGLVVLFVVAPAGAEDFTGAEEQEETLDCHYDLTPYPETQEPPDQDECVDSATQPTYQGLEWDNEVDCDDSGPDVTLGRVYSSTTSEGVRAGVCNDREDGPVQGRAVVQAGVPRNPFIGGNGDSHVYLDGDESNGQYHDAATGYGRVDATEDGVSVTCGDPNGRQDATSPSSGDGPDSCG